jgi:hypothetical protein
MPCCCRCFCTFQSAAADALCTHHKCHRECHTGRSLARPDTRHTPQHCCTPQELQYLTGWPHQSNLLYKQITHSTRTRLLCLMPSDIIPCCTLLSPCRPTVQDLEASSSSSSTHGIHLSIRCQAQQTGRRGAARRKVFKTYSCRRCQPLDQINRQTIV